jgi:hypothetical protein
MNRGSKRRSTFAAVGAVTAQGAAAVATLEQKQSSRRSLAVEQQI